MDRRAVLRAGVCLAGAVGVGGRSGGFETTRAGVPPVPENRPDGVYVPGHVEGTETVGTGREGDYAVAVSYSYAHRLWNVNGDSTSRTDIEGGDDVHLMASVWDPETGTVLPETGLSLEIYRGESLVTREAIYPMLSQPMGFHYGANSGLDGDYAVVMNVGAVSTRRSGSFDDPATVRVPFAYSAATRDAISLERRDDGGSRGAVDHMTTGEIPSSRAPAPADLPGRVLGRARSDDAVLVATVLDEPPAGVAGDGRYVVVSARTRYRETVLPAMGLAGTLTRGEERLYDGRFTRTLDPDLGYHYGAVVDDARPDDSLSLRVTVQPQTARHEGYETAFGGVTGQMPDVTLG